MSALSDWIGSEIILPRAPADRAYLSRALKLVMGSVQLVPDDRVRRLFGEKLAILPSLRALFSNDESLRLSLGVSLEAVRQLAAEIVVPSEPYVMAVVLALAGQRAEVHDKQGRTFHVRLVSNILAWPRVRTVVYVREDGLVTIIGDWREHLLVAEIDELETFFTRMHTLIDATAAEAKDLAHQLVPLSPLDRLRLLDHVLRALPTTFYDQLAQRIAAGLEIVADDLLPEDASHLPCYYQASASDGDERAMNLLQRASWEAVFDRLSGLPVRMPFELLRRYDDLTAQQRRETLKRLFRSARTPIAIMHLLRLVARSSDAQLSRRFVSRIVRRLLSESNETWAYLRCVRWLANELFRREECRDWTSTTSLVVTWTHANQVLSRLSALGFKFSDIDAALPEMIVSESECFAANDLIMTPAHPERVRPELVVLCGLADAFADYGPDATNECTKALLEVTLRGSDVHLPWQANLYFSAEARSDPIKSYFNGGRVEQLQGVLGSRFTDADAATFSEASLAWVLREKLAIDHEWWTYVAARLQGDPLPSESVCRLLLETTAADNTARGLRAVSRTAWCMRLNTLSHVSSFLGGEVRDNAILRWSESLTVIREQGVADRLDAATFLQSAADQARWQSDPDAQCSQLVEHLEYFIDGPPFLIDLARRIASRFRERLPATLINTRLARLILLARVSV